MLREVTAPAEQDVGRSRRVVSRRKRARAPVFFLFGIALAVTLVPLGLKIGDPTIKASGRLAPSN